MKRRYLLTWSIVSAAALSLSGLAVIAGDVATSDAPRRANVENAAGEKNASGVWAPAVDPKPLSEHVKNGLVWLAEAQMKSGAWGQGDESNTMGRGEQMSAVPSVADTCIATLALIRSGSTPAKGEYKDNVFHAVEFICSEIEEADESGMYITDVRGTRVQGKIGTYVDTFFAAMVLAEVKETMPDDASRKRVVAALDKVMDKIEKNQKEDGTWGGSGWAATMGQSVASKALNRAAQSGVAVDEKVRERTEKNAQGKMAASGEFKDSASAGVALYASSGNIAQLADNDLTNRQKRDEVETELKTTKDTKRKKELESQLERYDRNAEALAKAQQRMVKQLDDPNFIKGFGSNGGEEFLSYMNIGESLVAKGGEAWKAWDEKISKNLNRIQNEDGSWTGHHCITGKTFCTSAALLTLMVDRAPMPISEKVKRR